jgi:hypothetical protein
VTALTLTQTALEGFEGALRRAGAPVDEYANPGISEDEIAETLAEIGIAPPVEAKVWWGWRNGVHWEGSESLPGPFRDAASVTRSVKRFRSARHNAELVAAPDDLSADDLWHPSWLPIIDSRHAVAIDCAVAFGEPSPVLLVMHEDRATFDKPRAGSLGEAVALWTAALDAGAYVWSEKAKRWFHEYDGVGPPLSDSPLIWLG